MAALARRERRTTVRCLVAVLESLLVAILLMPSTTTTAARTSKFTRDCERDEQSCGDSCYNPNEMGCCSTSIGDFASSRVYNHKTHICCGGQVEPRDPNEQMICCNGTTLVHSAYYICCNNVLHRRHAASNATEFNACCGPEPYNTDTDYCCESPPANDKVTGLYELQTMVPNHTYDCCGHRVIIDMVPPCETCGAQTYNPDTEMCCRLDDVDHVAKKTGKSTKCCGDKTYDTHTSQCCDDTKVIPNLTKHEVCCPEAPLGYVNETSHVCCDGRPHERRLVNGRLMDVDGDGVRHDHCCGKLPLPVGLSCCQNAAEIFNSSTQQCCGDFVVPRSWQCCANRWPINPEAKPKEICCHTKGPITAVDRPDDDECCEQGPRRDARTYNSKTEDCRNGHVTPKQLWQFQPTCGNRPINTYTQLCCQGTIISNPRGRLRCCQPGFSAYDPTQQTCCAGKVENGPESDNMCFRGQFYSRKPTCSNLARNLCGELCYRPEDELCCSGRIHKRQSLSYNAVTCCGQEIYSRSSQVCFNNQTVVSATCHRPRTGRFSRSHGNASSVCLNGFATAVTAVVESVQIDENDKQIVVFGSVKPKKLCWRWRQNVPVTESRQSSLGPISKSSTSHRLVRRLVLVHNTSTCGYQSQLKRGRKYIVVLRHNDHHIMQQQRTSTKPAHGCVEKQRSTLSLTDQDFIVKASRSNHRFLRIGTRTRSRQGKSVV